jgi:hypothetical protein
MTEQNGDLWTTACDVKIIPTNGIVTPQGIAIMGAGVAAQAVQRFPMLPRELGAKLRKGNHVYYFDHYKLLTFPTKNHWRNPSTVELIEDSVRELLTYINPALRYAMPRVGTGEGGLDWTTEVRPLLMQLPDNVKVVTLYHSR